MDSMAFSEWKNNEEQPYEFTVSFKKYTCGLHIIYFMQLVCVSVVLSTVACGY